MCAHGVRVFLFIYFFFLRKWNNFNKTLENKFQKPDPHSRCKHPDVTFTQEQKDKIIERHNELRMKVASGEEMRGKGGKPQPAAKSMPNLVQITN